ncbi:MAG: ABC transporter permease [Dethiobacteria bacterium]
MFGREYVDRTLKDLLALPLSRSNIVLSKFIMAALWSLILSLYALLLGLLVGIITGLPGWSSVAVGQGAHTFAIVSLLTILLSTPVAFFASIGHGYLQPLGFLVFILFFSQIIAATGYGEYFPWSIPALAGGIAGEYGTIERASIIIVIITSALGVVGTAGWWRYADHS